MGGPDSFYTPMHIANQLISYVELSQILTVADFCVGDGRLLDAAHRRFPWAKLYGFDIDGEIIEQLARQHDDWGLRVCDFTDDEHAKEVIHTLQREFDLILLNPPFTCRGSIINIVNCDGLSFKVSTAMMFVLKALRYMSMRGGMYAILPISCIYSQKDRLAWNYLKSNYNAVVLSEYCRITFHGKCAPSITLVYIGNQMHSSSEVGSKQNDVKLSTQVNKVTRGRVRMQDLLYSDNKKDLRLIHTTNLQNGKLVNVRRIEGYHNYVESGYGVLIPRVCNPNQGKVVIKKNKWKFILSDCVIFLKTDTLQQACDVYDFIINNWRNFVRLYSGTGAQYTTLERVKTMFPENDR